jgi:hypothetical protein
MGYWCLDLDKEKGVLNLKSEDSVMLSTVLMPD